MRRSLKGLYIRHRWSQEIRKETLGRIIARCGGEGVNLLLKGAALDIAAFAARFADVIDWAGFARRTP